MNQPLHLPAPTTALRTTVQCLFIAVALLSACGGGNEPAPARPTSGTPTPAPTPPAPAAPTPPAPPPGSGITYYFSDCVGIDSDCTPGNNSNTGTSEAAPKQNLSGTDASDFANRLPPGSRLLFKRGGAWNWSPLLLEKEGIDPNVTQLVFDAYGESTRPLPLMRVNARNGSAIIFGSYNNTSLDGGYAIRNLKFDGLSVAGAGFFLVHNLRNVTFENNEITGFHLGIQSQSRAPYDVSQVLIRNNSISHNRGMGILGSFNDSTIENNLFEGNNASGSGFDHGTYLSGAISTAVRAGLPDVTTRSGNNITLRGNRYIRNSVVTDPTFGTRCTGGNMTFHGVMDNVLIEGNTIAQDPGRTFDNDQPGAGCWLMSITQGYTTAEGFTRFVVRDNRLHNGGNNAIAVQSAPGIVLEGNVFFNTQPTAQTGISIAHGEYTNGDLPDGDAVVRNNTGCFTAPHANSAVVRVTAPRSTTTNNMMLTGAAASTGACAR